MYYRSNATKLIEILTRQPTAVAYMIGNPDYPQISGSVKFCKAQTGVVVIAEISGLPQSNEPCNSRIFAFHIHSGTSCSGNNEDSFADVGTHYNPGNCPHPYHAGDMPPLFSVDGRAFLAFMSNRFGVEDIIGKTVIIHDSPDDFTTQPSGNSGKKIACGKIVAVR